MNNNKLTQAIRQYTQVCFLGAAVFASAASYGAVITVTSADTNWGSPDGNSSITSATPRSGNGSLELHGDRTRFFGLGNPFDSNSNIGLLSQLTDFSFEWLISASSSNPYHPDYTPALRLHIFDDGVRSELIWEGAYNNVYGNIMKDTWYQSGFNDYFYKWTSGVGVTEIYNRTIGNWQSIYSERAYVSAVSIGAGSGASTSYLAYADNLTLAFAQQSNTYNFETARQVSSPGGTVLLTTALLLLGTRLRRRTNGN